MCVALVFSFMSCASVHVVEGAEDCSLEVLDFVVRIVRTYGGYIWHRLSLQMSTLP
jgi:hypothetical protein